MYNKLFVDLIHWITVAYVCCWPFYMIYSWWKYNKKRDADFERYKIELRDYAVKKIKAEKLEKERQYHLSKTQD